MDKLVFISHSSKDGKIAADLCEYLEKNEKKCFIAPRDIPYGNAYAEEIVNGIDNSEVMVLLLSENSNQSPHVLREVERAVSKSIPILIYKLEDVELSKSMEYFLMTHQWMDAKKSGDFSEILKCVNNISGGGSAENAGQNTGNKECGSGVFGNGNIQNKDKKKTGKILAAAAVIVGVAVIITAVILLNGKDNSSSKGADKGQEAATNKNGNSTSVTVKAGDTIVFGKYYDEDIEWRVLKVSEDGKEAVLVSKDILCMKAFDAAESGKFNHDKDGNDYYAQESEADTNQELQVQVRGNSDWSVSNIRTWLNSSAEVVKYQDYPPAQTAMSEHKNGYNNEPGFLHGFTEEEIAAIKEVSNKTAGNELSGKDTIETKDRVYLLSLEELEWFEEAGVSQLAVPTEQAVENDGSKWQQSIIEAYAVQEYYWWLREPVEGYSSECYVVGNGYYPDKNLFEKNVGLEGYGIRPAMTVYVDKLTN